MAGEAVRGKSVHVETFSFCKQERKIAECSVRAWKTCPQERGEKLGMSRFPARSTKMGEVSYRNPSSYLYFYHQIT